MVLGRHVAKFDRRVDRAQLLHESRDGIGDTGAEERRVLVGNSLFGKGRGADMRRRVRRQTGRLAAEKPPCGIVVADVHRKRLHVETERGEPQFPAPGGKTEGVMEQLPEHGGIGHEEGVGHRVPLRIHWRRQNGVFRPFGDAPAMPRHRIEIDVELQPFRAGTVDKRLDLRQMAVDVALADRFLHLHVYRVEPVRSKRVDHAFHMGRILSEEEAGVAGHDTFRRRPTAP